MATVDNGPASIPASADIAFQLPGGPVTAGLEVHVGGVTGASPLPALTSANPVNYPANGAPNGTGTDPLGPVAQVFPPADASLYGTNIQGNPITNTNTVQVFGVTGATVAFRNPA